MNIGELVKRMVDEREPRSPDDLLNGPHKACECGDVCCGNPILRESGLKPGG